MTFTTAPLAIPGGPELLLLALFAILVLPFYALVKVLDALSGGDDDDESVE